MKPPGYKEKPYVNVHMIMKPEDNQGLIALHMKNTGGLTMLLQGEIRVAIRDSCACVVTH